MVASTSRSERSAMSTLVVIGAGPLLGKSIAKAFRKQGFRVALVARRIGALKELAAELHSEGIEAEAFPADITSQTQVEQAFAAIKERFGTVDVLEFSPTDWGKGADKLTSA